MPLLDQTNPDQTLSLYLQISKMAKPVAFSLYCIAFFITFSQAKSVINPHPLPLRSFKIYSTQNEGSCSYTVTIKTSCSSTSYTRDQISLAFGDAYGNQVYAPRIDDPRSRAFERCSTDTYTVNGPCTYQVCYVYLYRSGPDGWKPKTVKISGYYTKPATFYYDTFIPNGVWFGFNQCNNAVAST